MIRQSAAFLLIFFFSFSCYAGDRPDWMVKIVETIPSPVPSEYVSKLSEYTAQELPKWNHKHSTPKYLQLLIGVLWLQNDSLALTNKELEKIGVKNFRILYHNHSLEAVALQNTLHPSFPKPTLFEIKDVNSIVRVDTVSTQNTSRSGFPVPTLFDAKDVNAIVKLDVISHQNMARTGFPIPTLFDAKDVSPIMRASVLSGTRIDNIPIYKSNFLSPADMVAFLSSPKQPFSVFMQDEESANELTKLCFLLLQTRPYMTASEQSKLLSLAWNYQKVHQKSFDVFCDYVLETNPTLKQNLPALIAMCVLAANEKDFTVLHSLTSFASDIIDQGEYAESVLYYSGLAQYNTPGGNPVVSWNTLLEQYPNTLLKPKVLYNLGNYYRNSGLPDQAENAYTQILNEFSHSPEANKARGMLNTMSVNHEEVSLPKEPYEIF